MTTSNSFDWNDDVMERLRQFWADGHSTAEIGRRFGISKNAVVGKAHRLELPGRPSPIAKETISAKRSLKHMAVPRLTDVVPVNVTTPTSTPTPTPTRTHTPQPVRTSAPDTSALLPMPTVGCITPQRNEPSCPVSRRLAETCCWPIGEPGTTKFRFCGVSVASRTPYCPDHTRRAYVRRAEPSQDGASNA